MTDKKKIDTKTANQIPYGVHPQLKTWYVWHTKMRSYNNHFIFQVRVDLTHASRDKKNRHPQWRTTSTTKPCDMYEIAENETRSTRQCKHDATEAVNGNKHADRGSLQQEHLLSV